MEMSTCDFCKNVLTAKEFSDEFRLAEEKDWWGTSYYITKDDDGFHLSSFTVVDDNYFNSWDEISIDYCPICGRKLSSKGKIVD